jgi:hypothetical protein
MQKQHLKVEGEPDSAGEERREHSWLFFVFVYLRESWDLQIHLQVSGNHTSSLEEVRKKQLH